MMRFARENVRLTVEFEECYRQARSLICANPLLFHQRRFSVRRSNLQPQFGEYYIACLFWRDQIVILAVTHAKRRPLYFRDRIAEGREMV